MQAVTLTIPGEYWDSQIYSGKLYLFSADHSLHVYNWARAIDAIAKKYTPLQTAIRLAFVDGQTLYSDAGKILLNDSEIKEVVVRQMQRLASTTDLQVSFSAGVDEFLKIRDNPFPYPHADSEIYYHRMFVGLKEGLYYTETHSLEASKDNEVEKRWDSPVLSVKASHQYTTLACAAGDEGLREFPLFETEASPTKREPTIVARNTCTSCEWSFQSIFGSAPSSSGFLASFKKHKIADNRYERRIDRIISSNEIFSSTGGVAWGCKEKIYNFDGQHLSVRTYNPRVGTQEAVGVGKTRIPDNQFVSKGNYEIDIHSPLDIVSTATAPFGSVVETHDGLQVLRSDGVFEFIEGEPVSWRVFPRSENYSNQLHIVYEDRLEIRTYVHDYFVDQSTKWAGTMR